MGEHLIDGEFQSDKYPSTPRGKVPLSCNDPMAQGLLWEYAQRRRPVDAAFSADLETALLNQGFIAPERPVWCPRCYKQLRTLAGYRNHWAQLHWVPGGSKMRPAPLGTPSTPSSTEVEDADD